MMLVLVLLLLGLATAQDAEVEPGRRGPPGEARGAYFPVPILPARRLEPAPAYHPISKRSVG
jgi:hypothetical protein